MTVAFATLFLGLVVGVQPVEVVVGDGVARVELLLDGEVVGERSEAPWVIPVDFGEALSPHELVVVGRDAEGAEVGRARQWINLPRSEAEATVVLEGAQDGRDAVARVAWESLAGEEPRSVSAAFDGSPLSVTDPRAIPIPEHDPERLHLLRVELEFSANLSAVTEVVFGGAYGGDTATELTAVPVLVEDPSRELEPAAISGRLRVAGSPAAAVAVEGGPAEVVVVMDRAAQKVLWDFGRRWAPSRFDEGAWAHRKEPVSKMRYSLRLDQGHVVRFLWPFSRRPSHARARYARFSRSEDHPPEHGGMLWILAAAQQPPFSLDEQRLADAVGLAGMSVTARGRRRAVVLLLSEEPADVSRLTPRAVRGYLDELGVPLFVWSVGEVSEAVAAAWGDVRPVHRESEFRRAVEELSETLERQRIVWIEGLHLPQEVSLSKPAGDVRLLR